jgi:hypothetical protein
MASAESATEWFATTCSSFQIIQFSNIDGLPVSEQNHQDGEANTSFGRSYRQYEKYEYLAIKISQVMGKGDKIHIHRQQHQFDTHQQDDDVLTVNKYSGNTEAEQYRAEGKKVSKCQHGDSLNTPRLFRFHFDQPDAFVTTLPNLRGRILGFDTRACA